MASCNLGMSCSFKDEAVGIVSHVDSPAPMADVEQEMAQLPRELQDGTVSVIEVRGTDNERTCV